MFAHTLCCVHNSGGKYYLCSQFTVFCNTNYSSKEDDEIEIMSMTALQYADDVAVINGRCESDTIEVCADEESNIAIPTNSISNKT